MTLVVSDCVVKRFGKFNGFSLALSFSAFTNCVVVDEITHPPIPTGRQFVDIELVWIVGDVVLFSALILSLAFTAEAEVIIFFCFFAVAINSSKATYYGALKKIPTKKQRICSKTMLEK